MNAILTASNMHGLHPKSGRKLSLERQCCESAFDEKSKQKRLSPKCHRHIYAEHKSTYTVTAADGFGRECPVNNWCSPTVSPELLRRDIVWRQRCPQREPNFAHLRHFPATNNNLTSTITLHSTENEKQKELSCKRLAKDEEEDSICAHHQDKEQSDFMRDEIQHHWLNFVFKETRV